MHFSLFSFTLTDDVKEVSFFTINNHSLLALSKLGAVLTFSFLFFWKIVR